jgi:hypothetical protein
MLWTREQAKALLERALKLSKAEETFVALNGRETANLRFARNTATTSGATTGNSLAITASFGKRSGTTTTAEFDDASLERAVRNAEEIARLSPENPEAMPVLPPQTYTPGRAYFDDVTAASPDWRASSVAAAIDLSKRKGVSSAGFVNTGAYIAAIANSKGLFGFDRYTSVEYNLTARTQDGTGSGWASRSYNELRLLKPERLGFEIVQRAAPARSEAARLGRHRKSGAVEESGSDRAGEIHRRARSARGGRSRRLHGVFRAGARGRRGPQLLCQERRRQSNRRADRRREGQHLRRPVSPACAVNRVWRRRDAEEALQLR